MKIILAMVSSTNGKITKGDDPNIYDWTSKEDQDFFFALLKHHTLVVMGSSTYEAARKKINLTDHRRRIILTSHPERYKEEEIPGKLEFSQENVTVLVERLEKEGMQTMLLVGGGKINTLFFEKNLVNELYLTLEPLLFGKGKPLTADGDFTVKLTLLSMQQLNDSGTLLLHYAVK